MNRKADFLQNESIRIDSLKMNRWIDSNRESEYSTYNVLPIPCPVAPFLQVVLVDGNPLSLCTVYGYLCGIFLDDISICEQFAFLVYCALVVTRRPCSDSRHVTAPYKLALYYYYYYWVKAIFHNQIAPLLNTLSTETDVYGVQKVLSNNGYGMANCFCCLSQNAMVCLAHCRQELQQKSWKTARLSSRLRPRPRPNVQD